MIYCCIFTTAHGILVGIGAKSPHQKHKYFSIIFYADIFLTPQHQFWVNSIMTPAEQYRTLVRRLDAILEQGLKPPSNPPGSPEKLPKLGAQPDKKPTPLPYSPKTQPGVHALDPAQLQTAMAALKSRCQAILMKFMKIEQQRSAPQPSERQAILSSVDIQVINDPAQGLSSWAGESPDIRVDYNQFDDAPDNVLTFLLAHECGHIVIGHTQANLPAQQKQQQEFDADSYAIKMCTALGVTQAPAFAWLGRKKNILGRTDHETVMGWQNDPAQAERYRNATHPTHQQRFDAARGQGFDLSKAPTDQIDTLLSHMSRTA